MHLCIKRFRARVISPNNAQCERAGSAALPVQLRARDVPPQAGTVGSRAAGKSALRVSVRSFSIVAVSGVMGWLGNKGLVPSSEFCSGLEM